MNTVFLSMLRQLGTATYFVLPLMLLLSAVALAQPHTFDLAWGSFGSGDGQFANPQSVAVDGSGDVYVADLGNDRIQKFDSSGTFVAKWGSFGAGDGEFDRPSGVAVDGAGNVYVADFGSHRVQKFDSLGFFITAWGSSGTGDGQFDSPVGIAVDGLDNIYVADFANHRIQKFDSSGVFLAKWGSFGAGDGEFNMPSDVVADGSSTVYVADRDNERIQKFDSSGTFLIAWGSFGSENGQFSQPFGVAVDGGGDVYVIDSFNSRVQKFDSSGVLLAKWGTDGEGEGEFSEPQDIAVDGAGNVYVVDVNNSRIQKFNPSPPTDSRPSIRLRGSGIVEVDFDERYRDAGATAFDNEDGDISEDIVTVIRVDTSDGSFSDSDSNFIVDSDESVLWSGRVTYNVTDSDGNAAVEAVRTVLIIGPRSSGAGGGASGCFIATAAYGSPLAEEVDVLRGVRDSHLLNNPLGTAFVDTYYRVSPPIADQVRKHPWLAAVVRAGLRPIVAVSSGRVHAGGWLFGVAVLGLMIVARTRVKRYVQ